MTKIWQCKIGETATLSRGADLPMREAVARAYKEITGQPCDFIFSGWGAELTEGERAVVESRPPDPSKCDFYGKNPAALDALIEAAEGAAQTLWDQGCNTTASELFDALANFRNGDAQ